MRRHPLAANAALAIAWHHYEPWSTPDTWHPTIRQWASKRRDTSGDGDTRGATRATSTAIARWERGKQRGGEDSRAQTMAPPGQGRAIEWSQGDAHHAFSTSQDRHALDHSCVRL